MTENNGGDAGSQERVLIWLGGDVSTYSLVKYRLGGKEATSLLSAAALNELIKGFKKRVVLVPETLFYEDHCIKYRELLEAKSGYGGKKLLTNTRDGPKPSTAEDIVTYRLLEDGFDCAVVPHPGVASPLQLEALDRDTYQVTRGSPRMHNVSFNAMLNTVYNLLRMLAREGYSIIADLSHGTNPLVSSTLLALPMISRVYGVEVKAYMAPVMGRPGPNQVVEFIDMTGAVETVNTVAAGINAWDMLDERLLPLEALQEVGKVLGKRYGPRYGKVKALTEKARSLLWSLRSGQVPVIPSLLEALLRLQRGAERGLEGLAGSEEALRQDTPWLPVADAVTVSAKKLLKRLHHERNIDVIIAALDLLREKEMPDRALGPARELLVAMLLARQGSPGEAYRVGDDEWQRVETLIRLCATKGMHCNQVGLCKSDAEVYDKARQARNRLMHGRLTREENVYMKIEDGNDVVFTVGAGKPLAEPISLEELKEEYVGRLLALLKSLRGAGKQS